MGEQDGCGNGGQRLSFAALWWPNLRRATPLTFAEEKMMPTKRTRVIKLTAVILLVALGLYAGASLILGHPSRKFEYAVRSIAARSASHVGEQVDLSTYVDDQPLIGPRVTSEDVNEKTVWAYEFLTSKLQGAPTTYFASPASMPTQETIWQYRDYFVRLYVTSSLDSDGAAVGVFRGTYDEFREGRISTNSGMDRPDLYTRFAPIEFSAPKRFLSDR